MPFNALFEPDANSAINTGIESGTPMPAPYTPTPMGGTNYLSGGNGNFTYAQQPIPSSAYTVQNPAAIVARYGPDDRTYNSGQITTYNNGQRVGYNPNVPIPTTQRTNVVGDMHDLGNDVYNSMAVPALAMTVAGGLANGSFGGGTGAPEQLGGPGMNTQLAAANTGTMTDVPLGGGDLANITGGAATGAAGGGLPSAITTPLVNAGIGAGVNAITGGSGSNPPIAGTPTGGLLGTGVNTGQGSLMGTVGAGLGAAGQFKNANEIRTATQQGIARQDPFGGQRAQYQGMLANSYNDPNFFANNPTMQGLRDTAMNATDRRMAAGGYNMSGRQMDELNKSGLNESFKYALPFQQQLAANAGANIQPGNVGDLSLRGAQAAGTADLNAQGGAMNFLANLFGGGNAAGQNIPGLTPQIQSYLQNLFGPGNGGDTMPTPPNSNVPMPDFGNEMPLPTEDYGQYF